MTSEQMISHFTLSRRYSRSINLERDFADAAALTGYVVTERAAYALKRVVEGLAGLHASRAWMVTGVYGTGKSAFGHFLSSLFSSHKSDLRRQAEAILNGGQVDVEFVELFGKAVPAAGLVRAVATAQREPLTETILRALRVGVNSYWDRRSKASREFNARLDELQSRLQGQEGAESGEIILLIKDIAAASAGGLLILIDELGKCLEFAAHNRGTGDLYILQLIAELPSQGGAQVALLGLLHQAFSEYGYALGTVERNEWAKIQGRFEEIPFTESARQMAQLIGNVIQRDRGGELDAAIKLQAASWHAGLTGALELKDLSAKVFADAYPLHPVTSLVLPQLCIRYAQNDRSLFTFLASSEPFALRSFLEETKLEGTDVPLLKLDRLYDYFVSTAGIGMASRPNFQRWAEVKGLVEEHRGSDPDLLSVLKTIGILNLASTTGLLRASRELVTLALCDGPDGRASRERWGKVIDELIRRGQVTYRRQVDELRIWEGSDFDIDAAIAQHIERQRASLATLMSETAPLRPLIAQKHSYKTGTLRYFERRYVDDPAELETLRCESRESDGLVAFWVGEADPARVPRETAEGKPLVLIPVARVETLRLRALELTALLHIQSGAAELQTDSVARREVRHRIALAQQQLDDAFAQAVSPGEESRIWVLGSPETVDLKRGLGARLSVLCTDIYRCGLTLWNELINRQELTSQGAKASRLVLEGMLEHPDVEGLGLSGSGPEVSVYHSVLTRTGIHREVEGVYGFHRPSEESILPVWDAIEGFCLGALDAPAPLDVLYNKLQSPPYGVKSGLIPILFAAVIIRHADDVSVYKEGAYIPFLGPEHFELLVKQPSRFAVKHYKILGLRAQLFKEVEDVLVSGIRMPDGVRNKTLLGVVSPLIQFVRKLPPYTRKTDKLSGRAQAVRQVLFEAHEPDKLLFELLPAACGFGEISELHADLSNTSGEFRSVLASALKELREAYGALLAKCQDYIYEAFGIRQGPRRLREDLRSRASYLQGRSIEPTLTRFVMAATEDLVDDEQWLQGLIMVIADKPADSWSDVDAESFELKLLDVARRFKHLEAIVRNNDALWRSGSEARRLSIVKTDGTELNDIAWIDAAERGALEAKVEEIVEGLPADRAQQRALLAVLTERILGAERRSLRRRSQAGKRGEEGETHPRAIRR